MPKGIFFRTEEHKQNISKALMRNNKPHIHKSKSGNKIYAYMEIFYQGKRFKYARFLIEKSLRKKLKKIEVVHHKNGNTLDNRLSNLQVMTNREHNRFHSLGKRNPMFGIKGEKHPNWNSKKTKCNYCSKIIFVKGCRLFLYKKHFCNKNCANKGNKGLDVSHRKRDKNGRFISRIME